MVLLSTHNICFDKHQIFDNALLSGGLEYTYLFLSFLFSIIHIELKMEGGGTTRECLKDKKLEMKAHCRGENLVYQGRVLLVPFP